MSIRYPKEVHGFIRDNYKGTPVKELAAMTSEKFGIDFTYAKMKAYLKNHGYCTGAPKCHYHKYPLGMEDFVRSIAEGKSTQEIVDLVNTKFGEDTITVQRMKAYKNNHGIKSGLNGCFKPGHIPATKGKTWDEYMSPEAQERSRQTTFKKGHVPHNGGTPVGTIRIRKENGGRPYTWQKTAEPNVWRMKHVIEWEEHNGSVPEGCIVTFADGDTMNWHIDNLILETRAQHAVKNRWNIHGYDKESAQAANTIADIKMAVSKAKRRMKRK